MLCFSKKVCNTSLHQPIPDEMKQKKTILRKNGSLKFCEAGAKKSLKSLKRFVYQGIFVMTTYNLAEIFVCIQFRYPHNSSYGTRNFCYTNRSGDYLLNRTLLGLGKMEVLNSVKLEQRNP